MSKSATTALARSKTKYVPPGLWSGIKKLELSEQDSGAKKEKYMKKSTKNNVYQGSFGVVKQVPDFLPLPSELNLKIRPTKISINLETDTIEYFKAEADKLGGSYQRMIRNLLNRYVETMRAQQ